MLRCSGCSAVLADGKGYQVDYRECPRGLPLCLRGTDKGCYRAWRRGEARVDQLRRDLSYMVREGILSEAIFATSP